MHQAFDVIPAMTHLIGKYICCKDPCSRDLWRVSLMLAWSASLNEKRDSSSVSVASRLVIARDCPTQLRAPSANGK